MIVVLAGLAAGCRGGHSGELTTGASTRTHVPPRIEYVAPDPDGAGRVTVDGATVTERRVVHELLPLLGAERPITAITFGQEPYVTPSARGIQITLRDEGSRTRWLASLFGEAALAHLHRAGDQIKWLSLPGFAGTSEGVDLVGDGVDEEARRAFGQAAAAAFDVHLRVYPIGAIAATIRLDERQLLAPTRTDWVTVFGGAELPSGFRIDVLAPDGTPVFANSDAGPCFGCSSSHVGATPGRPLPATLAGATRLTIAVGTARSGLHETVTLDCGPGPVPTPSRGCDSVIRDRYALLPPMPSDVLCAGPVAASATITGLLGGVAINASYGSNSCSLVGARWIRDLTDAGLLARTPASGQRDRGDLQRSAAKITLVPDG